MIVGYLIDLLLGQLVSAVLCVNTIKLSKPLLNKLGVLNKNHVTRRIVIFF
jgi:hypothetical protein